MTTYNALNITGQQQIVFADLSTCTLSGIVRKGTTPVIRRIFVYRFPEMELPYETISDSDGYWELTVHAGSKYRLIILA